MLACADPSLYGPVVLFQDVIKILHWSMAAFLLQNTVGFELNNGRRISGVLVGIDDSRRRMVLPVQGFGQKALGGHGVAPGRKKEVDGRPVESTARYKYIHLPLTRTYVSSTCQESLVALSRWRSRRSSSGA